MTVDIYWNGVRVAKATDYEWNDKMDNDTEKHFDGIDITPDEFPTSTLKFSRLVTFDPNFEKNLIANLTNNIPIVVKVTQKGHSFTDTCTGGVQDSLGGKITPGKAATEDYGFTVLKRVRKWV